MCWPCVTSKMLLFRTEGVLSVDTLYIAVYTVWGVLPGKLWLVGGNWQLAIRVFRAYTFRQQSVQLICKPENFITLCAIYLTYIFNNYAKTYSKPRHWPWVTTLWTMYRCNDHFWYGNEWPIFCTYQWTDLLNWPCIMLHTRCGWIRIIITNTQLAEKDGCKFLERAYMIRVSVVWRDWVFLPSLFIFITWTSCSDLELTWTLYLDSYAHDTSSYYCPLYICLYCIVYS